MMDLTVFISLSRKKIKDIPIALYFHENQLSYPWKPDDRDVKHKRDMHYGFINFSSALAADKVLFNSEFHMNSFIENLNLSLDYYSIDITNKIIKSRNLPVQGNSDFSSLAFYTNALNTKTSGVDLLATYTLKWGTKL